MENGSDDLVYGPDDRLVEFGPSGSPAASFLHLPDGRRLEKLPTAGAGVLYHHDQAGNLITETYVTDPNGVENPTLEYIYLGSRRLALVESQGASGAYLPAFAEARSSGGGPWYAELAPLEGLKAPLWTLLGLGGVSLCVVLARRRPQAALTVGLLLAAGTGAVLWMRATPSAEAIATPGNVYFFHNGHLGEPLALTDNAGDVVWSTEYKPYGELVGETGSVTIGDPNTTGIVWTPPFRFPGQLADTESGIHYNFHRYYQPGLGTYTTPDPADLAYKKHFYSYAANNPIGFVDPLGLFDVKCGCDNIKNEMNKGVASACGDLMKPTCQAAFAARPYKGEDLWSCMKGRCGADDKFPMTCDCSSSNCAETYVTIGKEGGVTYICPGNAACPQRKSKGYGPTVFHESIHTCGVPTTVEPTNHQPWSQEFYELIKICTGWDEWGTPGKVIPPPSCN